MDAVIKVGGSLQAYPTVLERLCKTLGKISKSRNLLIVPGGGKFANLVRGLQAEHGFSDRTAHEMAILSTDLYGLMIHELIPESKLVDSLVGESRGCSVFLPYRMLRGSRELEPSWAVTSDSIAAWVARELACKKLLLVKLVDGIRVRGKLRERISARGLGGVDQSIVDPKLPDLLERAGVTCWIVNGRYPGRVEAILEGKETVCTRIGVSP